MATTAKRTSAKTDTKPKTNTTPKTKTTTKAKPRPATSRSDSSQVREGVTKARHGATSIVRQGAERAVDVPVGAALTVRDRVSDVVEPWASSETRNRELKSLRTQVSRELNRFERRGSQARRNANQRAHSTRSRVEDAVKQNRGKAEDGLRKAQERVSELA